MNPVAAFGSIQQEMSRSYNLPLPVTICVKALTAVHWVWWLGRKKDLLKPEHIVPAKLGSILAGVLKLTPRIAEDAVGAVAKIILIATRIDESIQRMQDLSGAFTDLKNAFTFKYAVVIEPQWTKKSDSLIFSAYTINNSKTFEKEFIACIRRIYHCFLNIFVKFFKLGMQLWDTYHAFVFSHDAIPELFVNSMYWFQKVRHNKDYINAKLVQYEPLIQNIFDATHANASAEKLIDRTKNVLNFTAFATEKVEDANNFIGENITGLVKTTIPMIKSKLLYQDLEEPSAHTPFALKKHPDILWAEKSPFKTKIL